MGKREGGERGRMKRKRGRKGKVEEKRETETSGLYIIKKKGKISIFLVLS